VRSVTQAIIHVIHLINYKIYSRPLDYKLPEITDIVPRPFASIVMDATTEVVDDRTKSGNTAAFSVYE